MKTLDEVKKEYAKGMGYDTWETFRDEFLNERTAYQVEPHFDIIFQNYVKDMNVPDTNVGNIEPTKDI